MEEPFSLRCLTIGISFFSDLLLSDAQRIKKDCFSIDMKNTIVDSGQVPSSNPRTYQAARCGLVFEGEIRLHRIARLGDGAVALCRNYVCSVLHKFDEGMYRLGNSKSRGYGKVKIQTAGESEAG